MSRRTKTQKSDWKQVAQGEVLIRRIDSLPASVTETQPEQGYFIVGHSETGHHHVLDATPGVRHFRSPHPLIDFLSVAETPTQLRHLRQTQTHGTHLLRTGVYEIRRQQELVDDDLWAPVKD